jgi:hypothetical protein
MVGMSDCEELLLLQWDDDDDVLTTLIEGDQMQCKRDDVIGC